ncbi:hypothetical protein GPECTOR_48g437 [Gonium pectorale]|uniref:AB hydrolase-1 domain-containing protein n=1 Tax=Gonium pectorale TaxID=33097 RepID=A0A150G8X7_GONPE|nr:hypothetical protein GPECTOR_48g437 [Gonium pectorale]|eukprot:KXZ46005.1 hypothetical protein GPECTOR_48g437 [Gonium pectorale]
MKNIIFGAFAAVVVLKAAFHRLFKRPDDGVTKAVSKNGDFSIYCLAQPTGLIRASMDIVFLHGLQVRDSGASLAWWSTWLSSDRSVCWPQAWLASRFKAARIFSVNYPARAVLKPERGQDHWDTTAIQLLNQLTSAEVAIGAGDRKVVLVGHSMGGLVLKQILYEAHHRASTGSSSDTKSLQLLKNLRGIAFYGTPHMGSFLADWTKSLMVDNGIVRTFFGVPNKAYMQRLEVFDKSTKLLQERFIGVLSSEQYGEQRIRTVCMAEMLPMQWGPVTKIVVEQAAATLDDKTYNRNEYIHANHVEVCKPSSQAGDSRFTVLVEHISEVTGERAEEVVPTNHRQEQLHVSELQ